MSTQQDVVLFLHPSAEFRGADRVLLQLVAAVDRERWSPVVVLPRRGPLIGPLEELGATVEVGPLGVLGHGFGPTRTLALLAGLPRCLWFVRRLLRKHRPALVHTHTLGVLGGALAARLMATGRHVWHVHSVLPSQGLRARTTARLVHALADTVVTSSAAAKGALERHVPALADHARLVRNCADGGRVAGSDEARRALRARLGIEPECTVVLMVGPLEERKGHTLLLDAAERLRYTHPDTRFLLVGDPSAKEPRFAKALVGRIHGAQLEGIVSRMPHQADMGPVYAAADVVCIPPLVPDTVPTVALEAMAAGKPVVAAAHAGTDEYVRAGGNGLFFEPGDLERLTWCLATLSGDPQRRQTMGQAALSTHQAEFLAGRFKNELDRVWSVSTSRPFVLPGARAHIVHVTLGKANPERANGVNQVVHHLAEAQVRSGLAVEVWGLTEDPEAPTPPRAYGLRLFGRGWNRFRLGRDLRAALDGLDTTAVVHLHGAFLPELDAVARRLRKRRVPYVVTPHGAFAREVFARHPLRKALWMRLFQRRQLAGARAVQVLSGPEFLSTERHCDPGLIVAIPNGQVAPAAVAPAALAPTDRRPVFAYCGRFQTHTKGLDALLAGFARHVVDGGQGTLWMIGDGDDRAALEATAEELGIARRVRFLGALYGDQKAAHLRAADAFVHPSRHEGMPLAVLEAAAAGLPLAVTPGTNLHEEVRRCHAGYPMAETGPEAVCAALGDIERELAGGQAAQRGQNAAWMAATYFTWERVTALVSAELYGLTVDVPAVPPLPEEQPPPHLDAQALGRTG